METPQEIPEVLLKIERLAQDAQRRARLKGRLDRLAAGFAYGAALTTIIILVAGILHGESLLGLTLLALPVALVWVFIKRPHTSDAYIEAKRLDRELELNESLAGAYDLARRIRRGEAISSGPFLELVLRDAEVALKMAQQKRRKVLFNPKRPLLGLAINAVPVLVAIVMPNLWQQPEPALAFDSVQQREVDKLNDVLAEQIAMIESLPSEQRSVLVDKLSALKMSDEERKKMTRSGLARRMRDVGVVMKNVEGAEGAVAGIAKDNLEAILSMEQISKQLADMERINSEELKLNLENGKTATADNITLMQADNKLTADVVLKAAIVQDEGAKALFAGMDAQQAAALAKQERLKKFRAKDAPVVQASANNSEKLSSAIMTNQNMQDKVKDALTNPNSTERKVVGEMYRQTFDRDAENLSPGKLKQLKLYIYEQTK
jgi:hypothetical protein